MYTFALAAAPVYFGLSAGTGRADHQIFQEIVHVLPHIFSVSESELILTLLSTGGHDLLVGGLLVMVMFSG